MITEQYMDKLYRINCLVNEYARLRLNKENDENIVKLIQELSDYSINLSRLYYIYSCTGNSKDNRATLTLILYYLYTNNLIDVYAESDKIYDILTNQTKTSRNYRVLITNEYIYRRITETDYDSFNINEYYKDYTRINYPRTILNRKETIKKYGTSKLLILYTRGLCIDVHNNIIYICKELFAKTKSTNPIHLCLAYLDWTGLEKHITKIDNLINAVTSPNSTNNDAIIDTYVENTMDDIRNKYNILTYIKIQDSIKNYKTNTINQKIREVDELLEKTIREYSQLLDNKANLMNILNNSDNIKDINIYNILKPYICEKTLKSVNYLENTHEIVLKWNMIPIMYYDENALEKSLQNILTDTDRINAVKLVLKGEAYLYTAPLITKIKLKDDGTLSFKTEYDSQNEFYIGLSNKSDRCNLHTLYNDGKGCRGTFALKIEELQKECNLQGLVTIIYQFYSSITINDPLGNCAIRNLIIADLNGDIINTGLLRDKPTFKNIKEINR